MAQIRNLRIQDVPKLKKMISMVSDINKENKFFGFSSYIPFPFNFIHNLLPLKLKFLSESYVLIDDKQINGMISLKPQYGNPYTYNINKLFLNKNSYDAGRQLIGYSIAKYGALGANTFVVKIDSKLDELMELFAKGCGFRMCSSEQQWKMEDIEYKKPSLQNGFFRPYKNCDAEAVKTIHNDNIFPHFRYSLAKTKKEFNTSICPGLNKVSCFKYVLEENCSVKGYFSIQTEDNKNFILDIELVQGYDECYCDLINFAINQIQMRKQNFNLFILNKKYQVSGAKFENYLLENNCKCVKNEIVMVKDYYKKIQEEQRSERSAIVFSDISRKPAFKVKKEELKLLSYF